jgi:hypothetical protein
MQSHRKSRAIGAISLFSVDSCHFWQPEVVANPTTVSGSPHRSIGGSQIP